MILLLVWIHRYQWDESSVRSDSVIIVISTKEWKREARGCMYVSVKEKERERGGERDREGERG